MIAPGSSLPDISLVDIYGREASVDELSTTGVPVILVASAASTLCRELEDVFCEFAKLDEGDYNVWALVQGLPQDVTAQFPSLASTIRIFAFLPGWEGIDALGVTEYPAVIAADRANEVVHAIEGWERSAWALTLNELRDMLGWRPQILSRKLPGPGASPVPAPSDAAAATSEPEPEPATT